MCNSTMLRGSTERRLVRMTSCFRLLLLWLCGLASVSGRSLPSIAPSSAEQGYFNSTAMQERAPHPSSFDRWGIYVVGLVCALVLIASISVVTGLYLRHKRRIPAAVSPYWRQGMSGQLIQQPLEISVPLLSREEVESACEDFSNIIGSSPEGTMYKGTVANGTEIAALSLSFVPGSNWEPRRELAFRNKVKALSRMNHPHLVNLIAYCSQEEPWARIFLFEYASNGTLYDHLHNDQSEHLNWDTRMRVVVGAAYGLRYMHHELVPPISHVSFGAHAVQLTDDYAAKVSNAGDSSSSSSSSSKAHNRAHYPQKLPSWFTLKGSYDERRQDPDFESDVYSFGVFLLEVITGRAPEGASLVDWAIEYLADPKMMWYMVDPSLESYNHDELVALCKIVSMCLTTEAQRPSMAKVAGVLADVLRLSPTMVAAKSPAALWAQLELQDDSSVSETT